MQIRTARGYRGGEGTRVADDNHVGDKATVISADLMTFISEAVCRAAVR